MEIYINLLLPLRKIPRGENLTLVNNLQLQKTSKKTEISHTISISNRINTPITGCNKIPNSSDIVSTDIAIPVTEYSSFSVTSFFNIFFLRNEKLLSPSLLKEFLRKG